MSSTVVRRAAATRRASSTASRMGRLCPMMFLNPKSGVAPSTREPPPSAFGTTYLSRFATGYGRAKAGSCHWEGQPTAFSRQPTPKPLFGELRSNPFNPSCRPDPLKGVERRRPRLPRSLGVPAGKQGLAALVHDLTAQQGVLG